MKTESIISLISRIRRSANRVVLEALHARGLNQLSTSHGDILARLQEGRPLPMKDIAMMINRKKNTVTALVSKLIQLGLVQKTRAPHDNRVTFVSLTPAGKRIMPDFKRISRELVERTYFGFSQSEREQLMGYLERIHENLEKGVES